MQKLASNSNVAERRRHQRVQLQMTLRGIRLEPEGGDVVDTLHMVDVSRSGMGALSDRAYYPGQRMVLYVPVSAKAGSRNIYATVVRCRQTGEGYRLGLSFDNACQGAWTNFEMPVAVAA